MKSFKNISGLHWLVLMLFCFGIAGGLKAQAPVYMELSTWKNTDLSRDLIAKVTTENDEGEIPAKGLTITYYVADDSGNTELGTAVSDKTGKAVLTLNPGYDLPKNDEDYVNVTANFEGNDQYEPAEAELSFKDVIIDLSFVEEDGTRYIAYKGQIIGKDGELKPLPDDDVYFFVPRMFSYLKIADGWFEANGEGRTEYPNNIIGDSLGRLDVHARILDHWDYGNVDRVQTVDWAVPSHLIAAEHPTRELWTPIAPLWMIITLIIMLSGVWGHYIYAMYELYMIRRVAKREQQSASLPKSST